MAIRVTTNYHTIYSPDELNRKLSTLQVAGVCAKLLGEDKLYNQLKDTFNSLKNQWESQASELCKQKTKTNWLGDGDVYRYLSFYESFEDSGTDAILQAFKNESRQKLVEMLNQAIRTINLKY